MGGAKSLSPNSGFAPSPDPKGDRRTVKSIKILIILNSKDY